MWGFLKNKNRGDKISFFASPRLADVIFTTGQAGSARYYSTDSSPVTVVKMTAGACGDAKKENLSPVFAFRHVPNFWAGAQMTKSGKGRHGAPFLS